MAYFSQSNVSPKSHHSQMEVCSSRASYREGRNVTAVKVYTISQESCYLLIQGVPSVGVGYNLKYSCEQYGEVEIQPVHEYQCPAFTEAYLARFTGISAARAAKKSLDNRSFFGGILHVCYAPEFETFEDTSQKLQERRKYISSVIKEEERKVDHLSLKRNREMPSWCEKGMEKAVPASALANQPVTYIWAGKEYTVYPHSLVSKSSKEIESTSAVGQKDADVPALLSEAASQNSEEKLCLKDNYTAKLDVSANVNFKLQSLDVPNMKMFKRRKVL